MVYNLAHGIKATRMRRKADDSIPCQRKNQTFSPISTDGAALLERPETPRDQPKWLPESWADLYSRLGLIDKTGILEWFTT